MRYYKKGVFPDITGRIVEVGTGKYHNEKGFKTLPPISSLLSDLVLVAAKLLAYTSDLLQSLTEREKEMDW